MDTRNFKIRDDETYKIVNMTDVNAIYGSKGDFRSCVNTINNFIVPELERLANSNVIQYGNVGTKPLFDKLLDEVNGLVRDLNAFADNRVADFSELKTREDAELQRYNEYISSITQGPTHTVNSGSEIMEVW